MSERTWERYGAATGIVFGILLVVSIFMLPSPPHIDDTAGKIAAYYGDHRGAVLTSGVLGTLGSVAALLFICHLRHVFDRVEGGIEGLSTVVFGLGLGAVAFSALSGIVGSTLAMMSAQPGATVEAGLVRALYDISSIANGVTFMLVGAWLMAIAVGMVRGEVATPALGWFAAAVGVVCLALGIGLETVGSYSGFWNTIGFVAFLGLAAWDIVYGATMMRRPAVETMAAHHSLIASTT